MKTISPAKMPTLREVAEQVGVSAMTASVVLNGARPGTVVAPATRRKVEQAALELGYKRNNSMAASRTGRFDCVALLLSTDDSRSSLPQPLWSAVYDELAAHNRALCLARLADEELTDAAVVPKILRELMVDGLLIDYTNAIPAPMLELIRGHHLPAIWLNSQQAQDCVFPDDEDAATRATRHLIELGHARIAYANLAHQPDNANEHYSGRARQNGYRSAMRAAGLVARVLQREPLDYEGEVARLKVFLSAANAPTALLCYGDIEPTMALLAARELKLKIPRDLSLVTLSSIHEIWGRRISAWRVPEAQLGRRAVELLLQKIENPARELAPLALPFEFDAGQTCAPLV